MQKNRFFCGPGEATFCCANGNEEMNEENDAPRKHGPINDFHTF